MNRAIKKTFLRTCRWDVNETCFLFHLLFGCSIVDFGQLLRCSLTHPMLITAFVKFHPEGRWEHRYEVGSLSPAEHPVGLDPSTFQFLSQRLNPPGYSPRKWIESDVTDTFKANNLIKTQNETWQLICSRLNIWFLYGREIGHKLVHFFREMIISFWVILAT